MKNILKVLASLLFISNACQVTASEEIQDSFFVGVDLSVTDHVLDADNYEDESATDNGLGLSLGYVINQNWSVGLGYTDYGKARLFTVGGVDYNSEATAIRLYGNFRTMDNGNGWRFSVSAGISQNSHTLNVSNRFVSLDFAKESKAGIWGGFGATYDLTDALAMTFDASWTVFSIDGGTLADDLEVSSLDVQLAKYAVGLQYSF